MIILGIKRKRIDDTEVRNVAKHYALELQKIQMKGKLFNVQCPEYIALPVDPLLLETRRERFRVTKDVKTGHGKEIRIIHREITNQLLSFLIEKHGNEVPAVYVHGPQGVGKSHSLLEVVCELRRDTKNRVLYIPDCGAWSETSGLGAFDFLLSAIISAFIGDEDILGLCANLNIAVEEKWKLEEEYWRVLMELPKYCSAKGLNLFAIFDQHNGLTPKVYCSKQL